MTWDAIGAIGEVLGAVAVVVTLLYLSKQISLTYGQTRTTGARELHGRYADFYTLVATDPSISSLVTRLRNPDYLAQSEEEEERIESFALLLLGLWLVTAIAYQECQIDLNQYKIYKDDVHVKLKKWPGIIPHVIRIMRNYPSTERMDIYEYIYQIESGAVSAPKGPE